MKRDVAGNRDQALSPLQRVLLDMADSFQFLSGGRVHVVREVGDLPKANGGEHQLEDNTVYYFEDFVTSPDGLRLGVNSILAGPHGGIGGFIHTGGGAAIRATNVNVFGTGVLMSAPGGTIFDVSGGTSDELQFDNTSFADPAGLGNISNLGTIDGMRVPAFKECNFEDFDGGLTFTGSPDKIFFAESPFREITASSVTILTFDASFAADIVDITNCYVKSVQADTEVIRVDPSATIGEVFQYRGTTHDPSVQQSNILNGQASVDALRFRVRSCYPLEDSGATASLDYDSQNLTETVTGSGSDATLIDVPTATTNAERLSQQSDGILRYDATFDSKVLVVLSSTVLGANTIAELGIAKNGLPAAGRTEIRDTVKSNDASVMSTTGVFEAVEGDTISATLENVDGGTDLSVGSLQLTVVAV